MTTIDSLLRDRGLTQEHVAGTLGITQASVSRKVSGQSGWKLNEIRALAGLLKISPFDVLNAISDDSGPANDSRPD